jgi:hypothetical protein
MTSSYRPRERSCPSFSLHYLTHHLPNRTVSGIVANKFAADTESDNSSSADAAASTGLTPGNTPTDANTVALDIEFDDVSYIATFQIGTPARDFKLLMDSGSADLWVGAEGCQSVNGTDCVSSSLYLFFPLPNLLILAVV